MREIKFRAWIEDEKKYFYFTLEELAKRNYSNYSGDWDEKIFKSKLREQFTGLHDKNGREIYEGDITNYVDMNGDPSPVVWSERLGGWFLDNMDDECPALAFVCKNHEIIGNIHENSELLDGGK